MHVLNLEVTDNPEEAAIGAQIVLEFCLLAAEAAAPEAEDLARVLPRIVQQMEAKHKRSLLHLTVFV